MNNEEAEVSIKETLNQIRAGEETKEQPKEETTVEVTQEKVDEPKEEPKLAIEDDPEAREFVEVDDPKVQKRLHYLYKQMKRSDKTNELLRTQIQDLNNENKKLFDVSSELYQWATNQQSRQTQLEDTTAVGTIRSQIKAARDNGNDDLVDELNERLIDLKAEQKLRSAQAAQVMEAARNQPQTQKPTYGNDVQWTPTPDDAVYIRHVTNETDSNGDFVRPWLQEGHEDYRLALSESVAISNRLAKTGVIDVKKVISELDKRMGRKAPVAQPYASVLSSSGYSSPSNNSQLTGDERHIADKLGMSHKDYSDMKSRISKTGTFSAADFKKK